MRFYEGFVLILIVNSNILVDRRDIYSGIECSGMDIKYEMVSILYNIGALHSQMGASDDRTTPEGLKMACTHFQCAAWAFQVHYSISDSDQLILYMPFYN